MSIQCIDNSSERISLIKMGSKTILKELEVKEIIRKDVKASGNGGAVWVPRRWLGQNVIVILPRKK
ncbi:hypothetical protein COV93_07725 [Candidatus Woesearchaeota archaeon CG11_big_fil_rev_8_21_14_0_20_43_8]|nr:MAG: hypothetical protein COV93_07725 [Candidatus Woesearchaeota archaeon CG11_big_fil_rev_8_21_14_0_20_43_8]